MEKLYKVQQLTNALETLSAESLAVAEETIYQIMEELYAAGLPTTYTPRNKSGKDSIYLYLENSKDKKRREISLYLYNYANGRDHLLTMNFPLVSLFGASDTQALEFVENVAIIAKMLKRLDEIVITSGLQGLWKQLDNTIEELQNAKAQLRSYYLSYYRSALLSEFSEFTALSKWIEAKTTRGRSFSLKEFKFNSDVTAQGKVELRIQSYPNYITAYENVTVDFDDFILVLAKSKFLPKEIQEKFEICL